jgi:hypothetical protein
MATNGNQKWQNVAHKFCCEICDYHTSKKYNLDKHLSTPKHLNCYKLNSLATNINTNVAKVATPDNIILCANCEKTFGSRSGLWRHKKMCEVTSCNNNPNNNLNNTPNNNNINNNIPVHNINDKDLIMTLIKENSELKTMMLDTQNKMMDVLEKGTHHTNSHNKTFNLQVFLNDTCKDAMNINDFVNNLHLQLSDLESMGEIGYVNGISNIIVKSLKDMDIASRPIHCTDIKRDVLYIKDEDKWDKETSDHPIVRNAIKHIAHKNSKLLTEYKEKYPDYNNSSSKVSDKYNKLLIESMGGKGDNDYEKENKIIKNVIKEVLLEKDK